MYHTHRDEFIWRRNGRSVNTTIFRFANSQNKVIPMNTYAHTVCCGGDLNLRLEADPSVFHFDHVTEEAGFICAKCMTTYTFEKSQFCYFQKLLNIVTDRVEIEREIFSDP